MLRDLGELAGVDEIGITAGVAVADTTEEGLACKPDGPWLSNLMSQPI